jgi:uncharacterized membrane protein
VLSALVSARHVLSLGVALVVISPFVAAAMARGLWLLA